MLFDAKKIIPSAKHEADLCIIGSGPAGLAIASQFHGSPYTCIVLEGGSDRFDPSSQAKYSGPVKSNVAAANSGYLRNSRMRMVGGSSNCWSGWCRALDREDFEQREWVPESGWPFSRDELWPFYQKAAPFLGIDRFYDDEEDLRRRTIPGPLLGTRRGAEGPLQYEFFHISRRTRYGKDEPSLWETQAESIKSSSKVDLYTRANVQEIIPNKQGTAIEKVRVIASGGKEFEVRAKHFVLATGGIENARLLLLSRKVHSNGIGNDFDIVGRYFTEHPEMPQAAILMLSNSTSLAAYDRYPDPIRGGQKCHAVIKLRPEVQKKEQLLQMSVQLNMLSSYQDRSAVAGAVWQSAALANGDAEANPAVRLVPLWIRAEQIPSWDNRVTVVDERDAGGQPKAFLKWNMTGVESKSVRRSLEIVGRELAGTDGCRVQIQFSGPNAQTMTGSYHHLGTTRMNSDPKRGVVDANLKVHGIANLHIAGASVMPTGGHAGPTFTITALAIRLAERLRDVVLPKEGKR